jgi:hypothetical protein
MFFCCVIVAAEIEVVIVLDKFEFLRNWLARGIFYFFIGVMTYNSDIKGKYSDHSANQVGTLALMSYGLFYVVMVSVCDRQSFF